MTTKNFPAPAVNFILTGYICSKTGGPQMYGGPDPMTIEKWFDFTPEQMQHQEMDLSDAMKKAGCDQMTIDDFTKWFVDALSAATAMPPSPEMITNKESLYGRLGGIIP